MVNRKQFSLKVLMIAIVVISLMCGIFITISRTLTRSEKVRESRQEWTHLGHALGSFFGVSKRLPEPSLKWPDSEFPISWRLAISGSFEHVDYYSGYDFQKPWNAAGNIDLASEQLSNQSGEVRIWGMPYVYSSPQAGSTTDNFHTDVVFFVGEGTAFPPGSALIPKEIPDGPENTLLAIELVDSGIHWLEPRDLRYPEDIFQPNRDTLLMRIRQRNYTPHVIFADFAVFALNPDIHPDQLEALITADGGESETRESLVQQGLLW